MKTSLYAAVALLALTAGARAADMPVLETGTDWSGFFVGAQVGYSWKTLDTDWWIDTPPADSYSDEDDGFVGGLYYGRNWQFDNLVLGLDSSISYIGVEETNNDMYDLDVEANLLGLSRIKVGYAFDNVMLFVAGGLATTIFDVTSTGGANSDSDDSFAFGWTIGAGIETKLAEHWSARLEYIYADIQEDNIELAPFGPQEVDLELQTHIVRVGAAYHF